MAEPAAPAVHPPPQRSASGSAGEKGDAVAPLAAAGAAQRRQTKADLTAVADLTDAVRRKSLFSTDPLGAHLRAAAMAKTLATRRRQLMKAQAQAAAKKPQSKSMSKRRGMRLTISAVEAEEEVEEEFSAEAAGCEAALKSVEDEMPPDLEQRLVRVRDLGRGASGVVYEAVYAPTVQIVAVKDVSVAHVDDQAMLVNELHALHENLVPLATDENEQWYFHHESSLGDVHPCPHIVSFYGAFAVRDENHVRLVMEYMDGGSLQDIVLAGGVQSEPVLEHVAFCSLTALQHMHALGELHRDIKPHNLLINHRGDVKVSDFGLTCSLAKADRQSMHDFKGTMAYMAPERLRGQDYSFPSDVWSLGLSLMSVALGRFPVDGVASVVDLEQAIVHEDLPPLPGGPDEFSPEFRDFLAAATRRDPARRATAAQLLEHPFVTGQARHGPQFRAAWERYMHTRGRSEDDVEAIATALLGAAAAADAAGQPHDASATGPPEAEVVPGILASKLGFDEGRVTAAFERIAEARFGAPLRSLLARSSSRDLLRQASGGDSGGAGAVGGVPVGAPRYDVQAPGGGVGVCALAVRAPGAGSPSPAPEPARPLVHAASVPSLGSSPKNARPSSARQKLEAARALDQALSDG